MKILEEDKMLEIQVSESNNIVKKNNSLYTSQTFYGSIYENLPNILNKILEPFDSEREKDVALLSIITFISGCLPNVSGFYSDEKVYANLYTFIIAPPASGKGAMAKIKKIFMQLHYKIMGVSDKFENTTNEKNENNANIKFGKMGKPSFQKMLFMPANTSSSALIEQLSDSEGRGIISETEADTVGETLKQDWGGYSDLLRNAFQHETYSMSRKGNNDKENLLIREPKLSICLTGTVSQIKGIIPNVENGLFSRFIYYIFIDKGGWKDPFKNDTKKLLNQIEECSNYMIELFEFYNQKDFTFSLTEEQKGYFNDFFKKECSDEFYDKNSGTFHRLGLITFRISMIFSALRHFYEKNEESDINCHNQDFSIAIDFCKVFLSHSQLLYNTIKKDNIISKDRRKQNFYDSLPQNKELPRNEIVAIGEQHGLASSTTDNYLKEWVKDGNLKLIKYGNYQKP